MSRLKLEWSYTLPHIGLQTTPLVSDGVMYVSGPNQVCALDARAGREIWCYTRTRGSAGAIAGDAAKAPTAVRRYWGTESSSLPTMRI